jgi:hypothetical protein
VASLTPWSDHNQSPRNMYQCQVLILLSIWTLTLTTFTVCGFVLDGLAIPLIGRLRNSNVCCRWENKRWDSLRKHLLVVQTIKCIAFRYDFQFFTFLGVEIWTYLWIHIS